MEHVNQLCEQLAESAKDLGLNLAAVLKSEHLSQEEVWAVALTASYFVRNEGLQEAVLADAQSVLGEGGVEDAQAAASLMAMNTIYFRFRHMVGKEVYGQMRAGLRMNRMMCFMWINGISIVYLYCNTSLYASAIFKNDAKILAAYINRQCSTIIVSGAVTAGLTNLL